jgi:hypothetical protein
VIHAALYIVSCVIVFFTAGFVFWLALAVVCWSVYGVVRAFGWLTTVEHRPVYRPTKQGLGKVGGLTILPGPLTPLPPIGPPEPEVCCEDHSRYHSDCTDCVAARREHERSEPR